jgi:Family of unknown function (DUF5906)/Primase C terminal 2 (PriCT-2)
MAFTGRLMMHGSSFKIYVHIKQIMCDAFDEFDMLMAEGQEEECCQQYFDDALPEEEEEEELSKESHPPGIYTQAFIYKKLKPYQLDKKQPGEKRVCTHLGLAPTCGAWCVPGYASDETVRGEILDKFCDFKRKGLEFSVTEDIKSLPDDACTRLRFDVDLDIPVPDTTALDRTIPRFIASLWQTLKTNTNITGTSRVILLQKPEPTHKGAGIFKHGFKLVCSDVICTHLDMLAIRSLMYDCYSDWGPPEWLQGSEPHVTDIIDKSVYIANGWLIYGSRKQTQKRGGYEVTGIMSLDEEDKHPVSDYSLRDLVHLQSIFNVEEGITERLTWNSGERPVIKESNKKRKATEKDIRPLPLDPDLRRVLNILQLAPSILSDNTKTWISVGFILKAAVRVDNDPYNKELIDVWHTFSSKSKKYDQTVCDAKWAALHTEDKLTPRELVSKTCSVVCAARSRSDLDFDPALVRSLYTLAVKPAEEYLIEAELVLKNATNEGNSNYDSKAAKEAAVDNWRQEVMEFVIYKQSLDAVSIPSLLKYMSTFFVLVAGTVKTEVVQMMFAEKAVGGTTQHIMGGFMRRFKQNWLDAMGQIKKLALAWLEWDQCQTASGFSMSMQYVHIKRDPRLFKSLKNPIFNTFCGFAIDRHISEADARVFKYDEDIVDRCLSHLKLLVNNDEKLFWYVVRWIAAPMQKRGYRTSVMLVNRSDAKGVGKGLWWDEFIGGCIYGAEDEDNPHFPTAYAQENDIDSIVGHFNEGLLNKSLVNMDECGIFDGATKQNEKLKATVTNPRVSVNQKFMSLQKFKNMLNFILTSNKDSPIKIEPGDRRFLIWESLIKMPKDYFKNSEGTGLVAFLLYNPSTAVHMYCYLMQLEMGNFYEMDVPMTEEKRMSMAKHTPAEFKFMQAFCMHMRNSFEEKDFRCEKEEFKFNRTLLGDVFDDFCSCILKEKKSRDDLFKVLQKSFPTQKKPVTTSWGWQRGWPIVLPSLSSIENTLRASSHWDKACTHELAPVRAYESSDRASLGANIKFF